MAIAIGASVTVSIAAETSGMFNQILRVSLVAVLTEAGKTWLYAGTSSTSSKASASSIRAFAASTNSEAMAEHLHYLGILS
jgi:hypothetical protein